MRFFNKLILTLLLFSGLLFAQKGTISGTIVDGENGEALIGANVYLENTSLGAATDLEGRYVILNIPEGEYTLIVSVIGYSETKISGVKVSAKQVNKLDVAVKSEILSTEVVEVEAKAIHNTEASLLKSRQKSLAVSDAISAEAIAQAGSGNAADAMKQVTGASVVDGKYVYVRGLGDRYTSTQLNGAELPGTDPYKRSGSIDLIPTNLVDNIVTVKSFTPDKPGNFSGGTVDIQTKDFPDKLQISVSQGTSYNSQTSYNHNGPIGYNGGQTDWLGYDDGSRALPDMLKDKNVQIPTVSEANNDPQAYQKLKDMTLAFNKQMGPESALPPVNQSYSFSVGNQVMLFNNPLGFLASLSYSNNYSSYDNGIYRRWNQGSATGWTNDMDLNDTKTKHEVLWGSLVKLAYKPAKEHQITFNGMFTKNAESGARYLEGKYDYDLPENSVFQTSILSYNERTLKSAQLVGEHAFTSLGNIRLDWKASTGSTQEDSPDQRYFTSFYETTNGVRSYAIKDNTPPTRYFRNLLENRNDVSMDLTIPFKQWNRLSSKIKFGALYAQKSRNYSERLFTFEDEQGIQYNGDPNSLLEPNNVGVVDTNIVTIRGVEYKTPEWGIILKESALPANNYSADQSISAGYAMLELPLFSSLRFIGGARLETTDMLLQTEDESLEPGKIKTRDVLPSANLIYTVIDNMNLRLAYSKTLARPTFREFAPFANFDFVGGDVYIGNPDLTRTLISNYDFRWEWFSRPGEIYALSAFYKDFNKPIERVFNTFGENTWRNVDRAEAYGLELEMRKKLDVIHSSLSNFMLGANLSLIHSRVSIDPEELETIHRIRPNAEKTRPFQGQSPYLANINLSYNDYKSGLSGSLFYNVFGKRLDKVSFAATPDVYEAPLHLLNASVGYAFTANWNVKLRVKNILNQQHTKYQEFDGNDYIYSQYRKGRTVSVGFSYKY